MKTCPVCSTLCTEIQTHCPECGAELTEKEEIKSSGIFSLKTVEENTKKHVDPSIGRTVSTGSGLTDILRADNDDDYDSNDSYIQGSIPTSFQKNESYEAEESAYRKKREEKKVIGTIMKLVLLIVVAFGIYYFVTNVLLVEKGAKDYKTALSIYIQCINDRDAEKLSEIVPSFYGNTSDEAQAWIDYMNGASISSYDIVSANPIDITDKNDIVEVVKLKYGKTLYATDTIELVVEMKGEARNNTGIMYQTGGRVTMQFVEVEGKWYFIDLNYINEYFAEIK